LDHLLGAAADPRLGHDGYGPYAFSVHADAHTRTLRLFLAPFVAGIGLLISGYAIAGLIAGWGLMSRCPWARMLAIVLGCISLIHFPFGTALGIYTLWVLVPQGADAEYRSLSIAR